MLIHTLSLDKKERESPGRDFERATEKEIELAWRASPYTQYRY
jgi:hypothetical protein